MIVHALLFLLHFHKFRNVLLALSDHDQTFKSWSGKPYKPEACDDGNVPARSNGTEL